MTVSSRSKLKSNRPGESKRKNSSMGLWLIGGAVVILILIVVAINVNNSGPTGPITQPDVPAAWINGMSLGNPDAAVTVAAYEDFLCPHCREWTESVEPQLFTDYIKTGKVRFEYHTFPLSGFLPGSDMAALAANCAADQGSFWPYHDRLFAAQSQGQAGFTIDKLSSYAGELNLNERDFTACMSSLKYRSAVDAAVQQGIAAGVQGTPSIFVNGQSVQSDYPTIKSEIDRLLAAAGQ
ncbi:MAG: thioredoxin domain-containing protein [Caldilineaceae bacterium]